MLRFTRPLRQALKSTTGIYGVAVHPDPLPVLRKTYESTLSILSQMPSHAVYRQGTEALLKHRLDLIEKSKGDATQVENALGEGQIEEILMSAEDELSLAGKMLEWKPWEPLEVKPAPGQWDYVRD
ncbi:ETC complex I subunit conserved region, partial [Rhizoctonia solani]